MVWEAWFITPFLSAFAGTKSENACRKCHGSDLDSSEKGIELTAQVESASQK